MAAKGNGWCSLPFLSSQSGIRCVSVITSSSTREYTVTPPERDGSSSSYTAAYQWRQTISFDECIHDDSHHPVSATQQLSVDSIFVLYNKDEQILRYAMSNSIGPVSGMCIVVILSFLFWV